MLTTATSLVSSASIRERPHLCYESHVHHASLVTSSPQMKRMIWASENFTSIPYGCCNMNRALEQLRREEMPRCSTSFTSTRARAQREAEAAHRRHLRQVAAAEKASRQRYASDRAAEVERKNDALADSIDDLRTLMDYV